MTFHPEFPACHKEFLSHECRLSDRILFLDRLVASEEYLETYNRIKKELKDEGVALYQDEAKYLNDFCLGRSETSGEDIKDIYYYIEKLKSIDSDFAAFADKEVLLIQATIEVFMREEIGNAINDEHLIVEAKGLVERIDEEEKLEPENEEKFLAMMDFVQEYRVLDDKASASAPEEAPEEEALEEVFEADYAYADDRDRHYQKASPANWRALKPENAMSERKSSTLRWIIRAVILGGVIGLLVWYLSK